MNWAEPIQRFPVINIFCHQAEYLRSGPVILSFHLLVISSWLLVIIYSAISYQYISISRSHNYIHNSVEPVSQLMGFRILQNLIIY